MGNLKGLESASLGSFWELNVLGSAGWRAGMAGEYSYFIIKKS